MIELFNLWFALVMFGLIGILIKCIVSYLNIVSYLKIEKGSEDD